jgi:hypothetical protein
VKQEGEGEWGTCNFIRDNNGVVIDPLVNRDSVVCVGRAGMLFGGATW